MWLRYLTFMYQEASWDLALRGRYCQYPDPNLCLDPNPCPDPKPCPDPNPCPDSNPHPDPSLSPDTHSIPASCSVTAKDPCPAMIPSIFCPWPKHCPPLVYYMMLLQVVTRQPHSAFQLHAPWWPVVTHSRRLTIHHHFPFISYPFSITHSCFNIPDPSHRHLVNPRSCDLSISDYYSSIDS